MDSRLVAYGSQVGACLLLMPFLVVSITENPMLVLAALSSVELILSLLALGAGCTAWGYILYFRLVDDIGPVRSLTVTFLIPPFGVLWGAVFLHEVVTWAHLLGGALIGGALVLVLWPERSSPSRVSV